MVNGIDCIDDFALYAIEYPQFNFQHQLHLIAASTGDVVGSDALWLPIDLTDMGGGSDYRYS
ncbi:hypothetical protein Ef18B233LT_11930 [Escherichia fergusonii]|nr:hypothetical protein Ef30038_33280 [Escherichia fergusonii]BES08092.1 hypothetical protein Ef18B006LT_11870 [Escherichia fergusonii]BES14409.1 hypothetical protein Ef18B226LT_29880 [Escherichia fergusonii]BES17363.1 hypothetical protein Ef18B233LT_11930 [Escherichia fergusonii]BES21847.1 hypothetical protein Ef18B269LT_11910 [Escherichia fergusonii]